MSMSTMAEAFAPAEEMYRQAVLADTWGHLAPRKGVIYRGHILFAVGCLGSDDLNPTALDFGLASRKYGELSSSPWFFDALNDLLQNWAAGGRYGEEPLPDNWPKVEAGGVYRWEGFFRNYHFEGILYRLVLSVPPVQPQGDTYEDRD